MVIVIGTYTLIVVISVFIIDNGFNAHFGDRHDRDRMIVGFTTTCGISAYHHWSCEFESRSILDTTLCDKVCQWVATRRWFSPGTPVSSTNKTDRHDITEILLKVELNTITPNPFNAYFSSKTVIICIPSLKQNEIN